MTSPLHPHPRDWWKHFDPDRTCTVCGWVEGEDNDPELHQTHCAHLRVERDARGR